MDCDQVGDCLDPEVGEGHDAFCDLPGSIDPDQAGLRVHFVSQIPEELLVLALRRAEAVIDIQKKVALLLGLEIDSGEEP